LPEIINYDFTFSHYKNGEGEYLATDSINKVVDEPNYEPGQAYGTGMFTPALFPNNSASNNNSYIIIKFKNIKLVSVVTTINGYNNDTFSDCVILFPTISKYNSPFIFSTYTRGGFEGSGQQEFYIKQFINGGDEYYTNNHIGFILRPYGNYFEANGTSEMIRHRFAYLYFA
jgi:hypothetical protein